ncbi:hypothetical protein ACFL2M_00595 [Patescibacteria group bacterium]
MRNPSLAIIFAVLTTLVTGCTWHIEASKTKTYWNEGNERTVKQTWVAGGPQYDRIVGAACEADSQCSSGYCKDGFCVPSSREHIHRHKDHPNPAYSPIKPHCVHDVDVPGVEKNEYGRELRQLSSDRNGCPAFRIGSSCYPAVSYDKPEQAEAEPPAPRNDAPTRSCRVIDHGGDKVFDCWPWGDPLLADGQNDYVVTPEHRQDMMYSGIHLLKPKHRIFLVVADDEGRIWLDGPHHVQPNNGRGRPYSRSRGDILFDPYLGRVPTPALDEAVEAD